MSSKESIQKAKQAIIDLMVVCDSPPDLNLVIKTQEIANEECLSEGNTIYYKQIVPSRQLRSTEQDFINRFEQKKKEMISQNMDFYGNNDLARFHFEAHYQIQDQLRNLNGIEKLNFENNSFEQIVYVPTQNQIQILFFMIFKSNICLQQVQQLQELIKKNYDKWNGKVQIQAFLLDNYKEPILNQINVLAQSQEISYYYVTGGRRSQNEITRLFEISQLPYMSLIDQSRKVSSLDIPDIKQLEININTLLENPNKQLLQSQEIVLNKFGQEKQIQKLTDQDIQAFKKNKIFLRTCLFENEKKVEKLQGKFKAKLEKSYTIDLNLKKSKETKSPLEISYLVSIKKQKQLEDLLTLIRDSLDQNYYKVVEAILEDPKLIKQKHLQYFHQVAKDYGIEIEIIKNKKIAAKYKKKELKILREIKYSSKKIQIRGSLLARKLKQMRKFWFKQNNLTMKVRFMIYSRQEQNLNYKKVINSWEQIMFITIITQKNQNPLVTYKDKCQSAFLGNQILNIFKNQRDLSEQTINEDINPKIQKCKQKWGQKLQCTIVNVKKVENHKELLDKNQDWHKNFDFYYLSSEEQNLALKLYNATCTFQRPQYIIVDQEGIIKQLGQPLFLIDSIKSSFEKKEDQNKYANVSVEQFYQLMKLLKSEEFQANCNKKFAKLKKENFQFSFSMKANYKVSNESQTLKNIQKLRLNYWIRDCDFEYLGPLKRNNLKVIIRWFLNRYKFHSQGVQCYLCKKVLNDQSAQYYSYLQDKHLCCVCAEYDNEKEKGMKRFKVIDNLAFINAPIQDLSQLKSIDEYKFGEKTFTIDDNLDTDLSRSQIQCKGCANNIKEGPRYVAMKCKPALLGGRYGKGYVNFCRECFKELRTKNSEKCQEILELFYDEGLNVDSVYLRILFDLGEYY